MWRCWLRAGQGQDPLDGIVTICHICYKDSRHLQVWRLLAQLVHEPDKRMPGSALAARRAGEASPGSNSFNRLASQLMNLTSPGVTSYDIPPMLCPSLMPGCQEVDACPVLPPLHHDFLLCARWLGGAIERLVKVCHVWMPWLLHQGS